MQCASPDAIDSATSGAVFLRVKMGNHMAVRSGFTKADPPTKADLKGDSVDNPRDVALACPAILVMAIKRLEGWVLLASAHAGPEGTRGEAGTVASAEIGQLRATLVLPLPPEVPAASEVMPTNAGCCDFLNFPARAVEGVDLLRALASPPQDPVTRVDSGEHHTPAIGASQLRSVKD
jgi:hypothetical protein